MKKFTVTTTYDQGLRVLQSTATLTAFIPGLPDKLIKKVQVDTLTMFAGDTISTTDLNFVQASQNKAMLSCCKELADWIAAIRIKAKADQLPDAVDGDTSDNGLGFDPVAEFENSLTKD